MTKGIPRGYSRHSNYVIVWFAGMFSLGNYFMLRRYLWFCGGTGMAVTVLHFLASPTAMGWNLSLSKVIAAETAMISNFLWNDLWTFRGLTSDASTSHQRLVRFLRFNLICLLGIGWSVILLNIQVHWLGLNIYLANFIAIVLVNL